MGTQQLSVNIRTMRLAAALFAGLAAAWPHVLAAQSPEVGGPVRVGDRWVYDTRDEMTGLPKETYTEIIAEISAKEITSKIIFSGKGRPYVLVYDHDWNLVDSFLAIFKPNEGQGIRLPLSVGKTWRAEYEGKNIQTGKNFKGSAFSKVAAQESITTSAGTFETFRIERLVKQLNTSDPSKIFTLQIVDWYAPEINHWARLSFVNKFDNKIRSNTSVELIDFSRTL
jgi:hypothetical protein